MRSFLIVICIFCLSMPAFCGVVQGVVSKDGLKGSKAVVDAETKAPVSGAKVSLPQKNYNTYTDDDGKFSIDADINSQTVMSIEKPGYKPFSMTIDEKNMAGAVILGIQKSTPKDIVLDTDMFHLGDNNYADNSANAREFQVKAIGPYYSKEFRIPTVGPSSKIELVIGSIIGVDTLMAKSLGQNRIARAYASPPEVYFNGNKIADIQLNGDGQKIKIPFGLIRQNQMNEVTIKTGRNMMQTAYVDYDDIEFMNLSVETN